MIILIMCSLINFDTMRRVSWSRFSFRPYDFEGKFEAIKHICEKHKFSLSECVFVGEGRNDIHAARALSRAGGLTIGYPSDLLSEYVQHDLWKDRLDAILDVIFDKIQLAPKLPFGDGDS